MTVLVVDGIDLRGAKCFSIIEALRQGIMGRDGKLCLNRGDHVYARWHPTRPGEGFEKRWFAAEAIVDAVDSDTVRLRFVCDKATHTYTHAEAEQNVCVIAPGSEVCVNRVKR